MGLKIEAGKQYVTCSGNRVRIFATDGGGNYPCLGAYRAVKSPSGSVWWPLSWAEDGRVNPQNTHPLDIVAEYDWREEIPWDHIRPDLKWIARSATYTFFAGFQNRPRIDPTGEMWRCTGPWIGLGGVAGMPKGPEDWRDTLAMRPEGK